MKPPVAEHLCKLRCVGALDDSLFGDDHVDQVCRRDVQHRIQHRHPGVEMTSSDIQQFVLITILQRGVLADLERQVDGGAWCHHHEAQPMVHGQDRQRISAYLANQVSVGRNAVGTDDDPADVQCLHQMRGSRIDAEQSRNSLVGQLPGSQTGALKARTSLADVDGIHQAGTMRGTNDAQRRTVTARTQGAGVGMGHQILRPLLMTSNQLRTQPAHGQIGLYIAIMNRLGREEQLAWHIIVPTETLQALTQNPQGPDQMHCAGASGFEHAKVSRQSLLPVIGGADQPGREGNSIRSGYANCGRPLHREIADSGGYAAGILTVEIYLLGRKAPLVEQ